MNTQLQIKFAALALSALTFAGNGNTQTMPAANAPSRAFPNLVVNVEGNTYTSYLQRNMEGYFNDKVVEIVSCTTGLITTTSTNQNIPGGSTVSVAQLTPVAQERVRANCNINGLRAGF